MHGFDDFEKLYSACNIPYPEDKNTAIIDKHHTETNIDIEEFKAEVEVIIEECEMRIQEIGKLLPFDQTTFGDAAYVAPEYVYGLETTHHFGLTKR